MGINKFKKSGTPVLNVIAMGIDFFRLAISLNKCLENYAMHTEWINGGK